MKSIRSIIANSAFKGVPRCVPTEKFMNMHKFIIYWEVFSPQSEAINRIYMKHSK